MGQEKVRGWLGSHRGVGPAKADSILSPAEVLGYTCIADLLPCPIQV